LNGIRKYIITPGNTFLVLLIILPSVIYSQNNFPLGSKPAALANTFVMESDLWSVSHNQAGLGSLDHFAIGFHHENKFLLKEESLHALALAVPVKPGTFGLSYSYFGYEEYNESKIALGFGKTFGKSFSAGIQLNWHRIYIMGDFGNRNTLSVEGGIQYKPVEKVRIGAHLFNPTRSKLSPHDQDTIPTIYRAGVSYRPFEKIWLGIETEKTLGKELRLKSGIEYNIIPGLFLRTGIVTNPVQNTFGIGYEVAWARADIAFTHHQILGFTPHFTIQFRL
jgi:hypothetical protein